MHINSSLIPFLARDALFPFLKAVPKVIVSID